MRVVSLIPSATELVAAIPGLAECLVGVSHECDYPPELVQGLPRVTRSLLPGAGSDASSAQIDKWVASARAENPDEPILYGLDEDLLADLKPTLIVTQTLCNVCAVSSVQVRRALRPGADVAIVNVSPAFLHDVIHGSLTAIAAAALLPAPLDQIAAYQARVDAITSRRTPAQPATLALLEWLDPPYSSGHWTPQIAEMAGARDVLGKVGAPSRRVEWNELTEASPDIIVVALCGFGLERTRREVEEHLRTRPGYQQWPSTKNRRVFLVDGNQFFSRPGPRLVDSLEMLAYIVDPELNPLPDNVDMPVNVEL